MLLEKKLRGFLLSRFTFLGMKMAENLKIKIDWEKPYLRSLIFWGFVTHGTEPLTGKGLYLTRISSFFAPP